MRRPLLLLLLFLGPFGCEGGQYGEEDTDSSSCPGETTTPVDSDDASLGISPDEAVLRFHGTTTATLTWSDDQSTTPLTVEVGLDASKAVAVDSGCSPPYLRLEADLRMFTDDGGLDDAWTVDLDVNELGAEGVIVFAPDSFLGSRGEAGQIAVNVFLREDTVTGALYVGDERIATW